MPTINSSTRLNQRLQRLVDIANSEPRRIIGLMSGTSLDGLDVALCEIRGAGVDTRIKLLKAAVVPYADEEKQALQAVVSQPNATSEVIAIWHAQIAQWHAHSILQCLREWGETPANIHCLASHGQTIWHAPHSWRWQGNARHASLQIGDGDHLASHTGIVTISDFRQKPIAAGGEGAPLAPYAELLICRGETARVLLNLGGVANYSWLPALADDQPPRFGDSGPANGLLDRATRLLFPQHHTPYDVDGKLAVQGKVSATWLTALKSHAYFDKSGTKSTGPELFGDAFLREHLAQATAQQLSGHDILATLTQLSAETIAAALRREVTDLSHTELIVSGGGLYNPVLCNAIQECLPEMQWKDSSILGLDPIFKEAMIFAIFANEMLCGGEFNLDGNYLHPFSMGKISFPL